VVTISDERSAGGRVYRRRRRLPALVLLLVLAAVVGVVWVRVLGRETTVAGPGQCPAPATPTATAAPNPATPSAQVPVPGRAVDRAVLGGTTPAAPAEVSVRVLNANGQRGQAGLVAAQLVQLGFGAPKDTPVGNDTVYADQNMQCVGQIRFGAMGLAQARTVQLVLPCAELVQDARTGAGVDLALGTTFREILPSTATSNVLASLNDAKKKGAPPALDQPTLDAATNARC